MIIKDIRFIDYPNASFSEERVKEMWNKAYTKDPENYKPEFVMRKDRGLRYKMSRFPGTYYCAFKDGDIVAYSGWRDNGDHFKSNGARTMEAMQGKGISNKLREKKMRIFNSERKPSLVILDSANIPTKDWEESWAGIGWQKMSDTVKDKLREWTGDDEIYLKYREAEAKTFVYFPTGFNKAWGILSNNSNHILQWEGY